MKLSPRLQCVADMVKRGSYIADIGTDHAYIPIYLIKKGIITRAIAADVKTGPLKRADRNIRLYGLAERIQLRQGYGLSPLYAGEVDCSVMAGMGGYLICDILEEGRDKADSMEYFIAQPVQVPEALRKYLYRNRYKIYNEKLVKENDKIYQVIAFAHGIDDVEDEIYYEIGKLLIEKKDPLLPQFIESKIAALEKIIEKIGGETTVKAAERLEECRIKIEKLERIAKCL